MVGGKVINVSVVHVVMSLFPPPSGYQTAGQSVELSGTARELEL